MAKEKKEKKKGSCLKTILIVIAVIVFLGVIGSIFEEEEKPEKVADVNTQTEEPSNEAEPEGDDEEQTVFKQGEVAEMNDVQVTLMGYEESTGSEFNTPTEGNVFVLANFEIANNSDSELSVSSALSFEAYADDYSLNYSLSAMLESDGNQLDGTIAPGKKMNGWIGYEVPSDWSNIEIHFTDNVWSSNKFVFKITK